MANDFFTKMLLGALTVGFTAWAGVVYQTGTRAAGAVEVQNEMLLNIRGQLAAHENKPWHGMVGVNVSQLQQQIKDLERRVERLEHKTGASIASQ